MEEGFRNSDRPKGNHSFYYSTIVSLIFLLPAQVSRLLIFKGVVQIDTYTNTTFFTLIYIVLGFIGGIRFPSFPVERPAFLPGGGSKSLTQGGLFPLSSSFPTRAHLASASSAQRHCNGMQAGVPAGGLHTTCDAHLSRPRLVSLSYLRYKNNLAYIKY